MVYETESEFCPLCGNILSKTFNADYNECIDCKVLVRKKNTIYNLDEMYSKHWKTPLASIDSTGGTSEILANKYIELLLQSLGRDDFNKQVVLDYGAGKGEIIDTLSKKHAIVYGYEPYGNTFLKSKRISVFSDHSEVPDTLLFDGIVNIDVIEHVANPMVMLEFIYHHLKPGGWLFIACPNNKSLNALINGQSWRETKNPGHLCLFSSIGLEKLLVKVGFNQIIRLKWFVDYSLEPGKNLIYRILTILKLDGELRFLCTKPNL